MVTAMSFTACDDDWETPPAVIPTAPAGMTANTSIADLKAAYWSTDRNSAKLIGQTDDGQDIIICGRVVSCDSAGNIYKNLVIEDLETGEGLTIAVNQTELYQTYQVGQVVYVNATGLYGGMYNNLFQLGALGSYNSAPAVTYITEDDFAQHAYPDGFANANKIDTTVVTLSELAAANNDVALRREYMSRLVRIDSVRFEDGGKAAFSESGSSTNRMLRDAKGNRIIVRNSSYASFMSKILPTGYGSVTAILSYYGTDGWQLLLNNWYDCKGFTKWPASTNEAVDPVSSLNVTFDDGSIPDGWTQMQISGNKAWYVTSFSDNYYAAMTGYKGTAPFDQWLISPPVEMDKVTDKTLSFRTQVAGYGATTTTLEVYVLNNANPDKATVKDKLDAALPAYSTSSTYSDWLSSGNLDLSKYTGKIYIAFRYAATTDSNYATWCVDDITLNK